jgi:FkbM family methyltransferase
MKFTSVLYKYAIGFYKLLPFKKYICLTIKKIGFPRKFCLDLRFSGIYKVKIQNKKFKLRNYKYTTVENEIFWKGIENGWEKVSLNLWAELSKRSKVIFDIGANTGVFSLVAKTLNPEADVFAFEPSVRVYQKLLENNRINKFNIITEQIALSNIDGTGKFYDVNTEHQYSASLSENMKQDLVTNWGPNLINEYVVQAKTIKTFIEEKQIGHIDLIKLDVEYHEPEVLEGMGIYLEKFEPTFIIEILTDELAERIETYFRGKRYFYFSIDEESVSQQLSSLKKSNFHNFLICQEEIARFLKLI